MREIPIKDFDFSNLEHRTDLVDHRDFCYGHYNINGGVATVGGARVGNKLYFTVSFCAPNDNFSRATGRELAQTYMIEDCHSDRRCVLDISNFINAFPVVVLCAGIDKYIARNRHIPNWAHNPKIIIRGKRHAV